MGKWEEVREKVWVEVWVWKKVEVGVEVEVRTCGGGLQKCGDFREVCWGVVRGEVWRSVWRGGEGRWG